MRCCLQVLKAKVQALEAEAMANYEVGFEFAFQQLLKFNATEADSEEGADCNRVIMFLTDGGSDHAQHVFDKYNKDKRVWASSVSS